jgi:hypothetical protein
MAAKSPTNLNTSRNIGIRMGVQASNLKEPDCQYSQPITNDDPANKVHPTTIGTKAPATVKKPF